MSSPAGLRTRARSASGTSRLPSTDAARIRLPTSATYGTPARSAASSAGSSSRPCEATTSPASSARGAAEASAATSAANPAGSAIATSAAATGVSPTTSTRGSGRRGCRKISSAPPDTHGFATVTAPSSSTVDAGPGSTRSSTGSPLCSTRSPYSRTDSSAQVPPTKPSIRPSGKTSALSPACALVGCWARTTIACANGTRARTSSAAWVASCSRISPPRLLRSPPTGGWPSTRDSACTASRRAAPRTAPARPRSR